MISNTVMIHQLPLPPRLIFQEETSAFCKSLYQSEFKKSIYHVSLDTQAEFGHKTQL